jgi:hypothetical protein
MPKHPDCPEHNRFKIAGSGLDLFAKYEGIGPVLFIVEAFGPGEDDEEVEIYGGRFCTSPLRWLLAPGDKPRKMLLTDRYNITRCEEEHSYCVTPDTQKDGTFKLTIRRE